MHSVASRTDEPGASPLGSRRDAAGDGPRNRFQRRHGAHKMGTCTPTFSFRERGSHERLANRKPAYCRYLAYTTTASHLTVVPIKHNVNINTIVPRRTRQAEPYYTFNSRICYYMLKQQTWYIDKVQCRKTEIKLEYVSLEQTTLKLLRMQNHHFVHSQVKC